MAGSYRHLDDERIIVEVGSEHKSDDVSDADVGQTQRSLVILLNLLMEWKDKQEESIDRNKRHLTHELSDKEKKAAKIEDMQNTIVFKAIIGLDHLVKKRGQQLLDDKNLTNSQKVEQLEGLSEDMRAVGNFLANPTAENQKAFVLRTTRTRDPLVPLLGKIAFAMLVIGGLTMLASLFAASPAILLAVGGGLVGVGALIGFYALVRREWLIPIAMTQIASYGPQPVAKSSWCSTLSSCCGLFSNSKNGVQEEEGERKDNTADSEVLATFTMVGAGKTSLTS